VTKAKGMQFSCTTFCAA